MISNLLYIISFLIILPSLCDADEIDLRIFGIKVGKVERDSFTNGQKIGYTVLNYFLSGLTALGIALVLLCCCCVCLCIKKDKKKDEENSHDEHDDDVVNARSVGSDGYEGNEGSEGNRSEKDEKTQVVKDS